MEKTFTLIKREYPFFSKMENSEILDLIGQVNTLPNARSIFIDMRHTLAPVNLPLAQEMLRNFQLPEGWGNLLVDLSKPLLENIPTAATFTCSLLDPSLIALIQTILVHSLLLKKGKKAEDAVLTRGDSIEIARDEAYAESLALNAQDLLSIFQLMPKLRLRSRGTCLFSRMLDCIKGILETPY